MSRFSPTTAVSSSRSAMFAATLVVVATSWVATSCVATVQERAPRSTYVAGAPPLPLSETRPAPPAPGMLWARGYWHWAEVQYVWVPGHWESPPEALAGARTSAGREAGR